LPAKNVDFPVLPPCNLYYNAPQIVINVLDASRLSPCETGGTSLITVSGDTAQRMTGHARMRQCTVRVV